MSANVFLHMVHLDKLKLNWICALLLAVACHAATLHSKKLHWSSDLSQRRFKVQVHSQAGKMLPAPALHQFIDRTPTLVPALTKLFAYIEVE